jgi:hypothetical protein
METGERFGNFEAVAGGINGCGSGLEFAAQLFPRRIHK